MSVPHARLSSVASIVREGVDPRRVANGTRYVGLEHISSDGGFSSAANIEATELASTKFAFGDQHILFGKLRPYLRKVVRPTFAGICSTDIIPIAPGPNLDRDYLFHFLRTDQVIDRATSMASGANLPRISPKHLIEFEIPLPSLDEQRRIAAVLDHADTLRRMRRTAIERLEEFVSAAFSELFAEISGGASDTSLGDLFEITRGGSPRPIADYLTDEPDGLNWVSISDATDNGKFIRTVKRRIRPSGASRSRRVDPGDFLLTNSMSFGRPYIMATTGYIHDGWLSLRPKDDRIDQEYLYRALSSRQTYAKFARLASGATVKNLNIDLVRTVTIPVPPIAVQNRFADMAKVVDQTVDRAKAHLGHLDALFASLQHRAYSGEL